MGNSKLCKQRSKDKGKFMKRIISIILVLIMTSSLFTLAGCGLVEELCPHTFGELETVAGTPATCTESGLTEGKKCSLCGGIVTPQEAISSLGHAYKYHTETDAEGNRINVAICQRDGCGETTTVSDKERLIGEWREASGINEGDIEITIRYYIATPIDNIRAPLRIKISADNIYFSNHLYGELANYLYSEVECVNNPTIDYKSVLYTNMDTVLNGEKVSETIKKIQALEYCYKLEPQGIYRELEAILVYKLDDRYYFLGFQDQELWIIHCTNFKDGV